MLAASAALAVAGLAAAPGRASELEALGAQAREAVGAQGPTAAPAPAPAGDALEREVHRQLGILDYLASDYPGAVEHGRVVSEIEYAEQRAFAEDAAALARDLPAARAGAVVAAADALRVLVDARAEGAEVAAASALARRRLLEAFPVPLAPARTPSLENGRALYAASCAVCHAPDGGGATPLAATLDPPPTSFLGEKARGALSPYRAFNALTFGVAGTAMPSFDVLSERDRWDLAFYAVALRHPGAPAPGDPSAAAPAVSLGELANATDEALAERLAAGGVPAGSIPARIADLRTRAAFEPPPAAKRLDAARDALARAVATYRSGDAREAQRLAVEAYLAFEPLEPRLRDGDPDLVPRVEARYLDLRRAVRDAAPAAEVERIRSSIESELARAEAQLTGADDSTGVAFVASALIVLREGIEAALLVAAMLALLAKLGRRDAARLVHAGWISAIAAGLLTWWASTRVIAISGAERELVEGVVGCVAAAVLAYTSFWIVSRAQAKRWLDAMRAKLSATLGRGGAATLFGLAFLAAYREAFETVLFLQALIADRGPGAAVPVGLGVAAGAAGLLLAILLLFRVAKRIPMSAFFNVSGAMLYALAFVFAGSGVHALIEGGYVEPRPVESLAFLRVDWLGIYPDAAVLGVQAAMLLAVAIGLAIELRARRQPLRRKATNFSTSVE